MYLKRLEIHGFKSFAHKTVLEFEPGMTAVVGPNGSGKSNVADSLRWVMGEQSMKLLRGKKSEDVIFAGSDKKSKLSMAEVSLTFDNKDHKLPYDYAEVVMTRRLYRSGESEYLINNQRARLIDIVDALIRSGFGASNYAVIGQGTIDQMILAGPAEIKNLIEEASGVKPYYMKRDKSLRRLEQTEENLNSVSQLLNEIEPRLKSLRRQAKRMEERESLEKEYAELNRQFFGHQYYLLDKELSGIAAAFDERDSQIKKLEQEIGSFQTILEKEEVQTGKSNSFLDELDKKGRELEQKKLDVLEKLAEIKGKLKVPVARDFSLFRRQFEEIIESLTPTNLAAVKLKLKELVADFGQSDNAELLKQKQGLDEQLENLVQEIHEHNNTREKLLAEEKQKKNFLTEEEKRYRAKSSELNRLKEDLTRVMVEKAKVETRLETMLLASKEAIGKAVEAADKLAEVPADLEHQIGKLKRQLELAGGMDEMTMNEYRETEERFNYLSTQSTDLAKAMEDLKVVIADLDEVIKKQFDEAFEKISTRFSEYFRVLFNGGRAQMTILREVVNDETDLDDEDDAEAEDAEPVHKGTKQIVGIEIKATPPGKKLATIAALSGGERALTAIALLCAMLAAYPSPFVVLDEVDAALDEANSIRFAKILGTLAHQTQFVTITHNRETMREAHTLYGVTMSDEGISKILSIKLEQAEKVGTR
jgi:chromosome segregation protein